MNLPAFLGPFTAVPTSAAVAKFAAPLGGAAASLPFSMQTQQQTNWCWAATSTSVSLFYSAASAWTQCSVATQCLGGACCTQPGPCNTVYYLDQALSATGNLASTALGALAFASIKTEIDNGRPPCCHISWSGGGGHFNTIHGYDDATNDVDVADPFYGAQTLPYATFVNSYRGVGVWDYSYLTT